MRCGICGSDNTKIIYDDVIRNGAIGVYTDENYQMYQCKDCGTIFHKLDESKSSEYYQSAEYRKELENTVDISDYYRSHDKEVLEKLEYTGTDIFRKSVVADIGCGGGSFLDFVSGPAAEIIAIEPSAEYRRGLKDKKYHTYTYASDALKDFQGKVDVVTSFDVIEHVNSPSEFMQDVFDLLKDGGIGIIGTPTDCPFMRKLLGHTYEQRLLFSYQHPWILSGNGFELCCKQAGFLDIRIDYKQRYGLSNVLAWCIEKKPEGHNRIPEVTAAMSDVYRRELEQNGMADYIVAYVRK